MNFYVKALAWSFLYPLYPVCQWLMANYDLTTILIGQSAHRHCQAGLTKVVPWTPQEEPMGTVKWTTYTALWKGFARFIAETISETALTYCQISVN